MFLRYVLIFEDLNGICEMDYVKEAGEWAAGLH